MWIVTFSDSSSERTLGFQPYLDEERKRRGSLSLKVWESKALLLCIIGRRRSIFNLAICYHVNTALALDFCKYYIDKIMVQKVLFDDNFTSVFYASVHCDPGHKKCCKIPHFVMPKIGKLFSGKVYSSWCQYLWHIKILSDFEIAGFIFWYVKNWWINVSFFHIRWFNLRVLIYLGIKVEWMDASFTTAAAVAAEFLKRSKWFGGL